VDGLDEADVLRAEGVPLVDDAAAVEVVLPALFGGEALEDACEALGVGAFAAVRRRMVGRGFLACGVGVFLALARAAARAWRARSAPEDSVTTGLR
jgi:hypothetical protein